MPPATVSGPTGSCTVPVTAPPSATESVSEPVVRMSPSTVPPLETATVCRPACRPAPKARTSPVTLPATVRFRSPASLRSASVPAALSTTLPVPLRMVPVLSTSTPVRLPVPATVTVPPLV